MYPRTGTTSPILVNRDPQSAPQAVQPSQDYFLVKIHAAQAAFRGSIWDRVKGLVITSQVNLNHRNLGSQGLRAIQRTREVRKNEAQPLGLSPNLIHLVPAVMPSVSIGIAFVLDKENQLVKLSGLINSDSFFSTLSLAAGPAAVAKTVAGLADKMIQTFIPPNDQKPILEFNGDFNLATQDLKDGYYVIVGSNDDANPLPDPSIRLTVKDGNLFVGGTPATQWSYVIFDVQRTPTRPREMSDGAPWASKLREAEDEAKLVMQNPLATDDERKQTWNKCLRLIQEAQTLLRADDNFLMKDADNIVTAALNQCRQLVDPTRAAITRGDAKAARAWMPELHNDLTALGLPPDMDVNKTLDAYAAQVLQARRTLKAAGLT
jgi:hypothetical protein